MGNIEKNKIIQQWIELNNNDLIALSKSLKLDVNKTYIELESYKQLLLNQPVIEFQDVCLSYDKKNNSLKNVSFKVYPGKFHLFIGDNGAGKSTTMKLMMGLIKSYSGRILINNKDIKIGHNIYNNIFYFPDKGIFCSSMSIWQYLYNIASLECGDSKELKIKINDLLKEYGIFEIRNKNPNKISAGQKKKVMLILMILENPKIIILDEPTANLDPSTQIMFFDKLKDMQKNGSTIFISTHHINDIAEYVDYVTYIKKGEIIYSDEVNKEDSKNLYKNFFVNNALERKNDND